MKIRNYDKEPITNEEVIAVLQISLEDIEEILKKQSETDMFNYMKLCYEHAIEIIKKYEDLCK